MTLKDMLVAFVAFREEVVSRRTKFLLNKARDRAHILVGLAIAVANIDEVIKLIRASKDANEAREALMAREWPATTAASLIELIDDPRHKVSAKGTARLSVEQAKAILDLRLQRLTALRPRGDQGRARQARRRDRRLSRHPALARAHPDHHQGRTDRAEGRIRHAAPHRDRRSDRRGRGRGPDPARGHGRHRLASRLHQARAALDLSRAEARRQRPRRHAGARGGFRLAAVRRLDAYAGAVLLLGRPGLQGKGLAAAAGGAAGARQGADQYPAARSGRDHHHHHAAARGREDLGQARRDVRHHQGHGAAQQAVRLRRRAPLRHHRDEARARARPSSTSRSAPRRTTCCSPRPAASASASRCRRCACSPAAPRWACAASRSARTTR